MNFNESLTDTHILVYLLTNIIIFCYLYQNSSNLDSYKKKRKEIKKTRLEIDRYNWPIESLSKKKEKKGKKSEIKEV